MTEQPYDHAGTRVNTVISPVSQESILDKIYMISSNPFESV